MDRAGKEQLSEHLHQVLSSTTIVVVTHYIGLNVTELGDLRRRMRAAGAEFKVTKNRITRRAIEGTPYNGLADLFVGPTAIAYSEDPVAAAKAAVDFAKVNPKLVLLGGGLGEKVLDAETVKALAALPSLDELRAKIVGLVNAPATRIAGVLQAPAGQIARVIKAHAEQGEAA